MAKSNIPFPDFDVTKMMADMKFPGVNVDSLMATSKRNIDAVNAANQLAAEGMQAIAKRQAEILREAMEQAAKASSEMMIAGNPEDKMAKQAELVKEAFESALANMKEMAEMMAKSQTEAFDVINQRVSESMDELKTTMQRK